MWHDAAVCEGLSKIIDNYSVNIDAEGWRSKSGSWNEALSYLLCQRKLNDEDFEALVSLKVDRKNLS